MCMFTGPIELVADTKIFAARHGPRQALAYQMRVAARAPVAMVLPIPAVDADVAFVDLSGCADFFARIDAAMPDDELLGTDSMGDDDDAGAVLAVTRVGSFEASLVPRREEFLRLDRRFRLPDTVWLALPPYVGWSFAVFQLAADASTVHPMALTFRSRLADDAVFFPTVHVHDGDVAPVAGFDHGLYLQGQPGRADGALPWLRSRLRADLAFAGALDVVAPLVLPGAFLRRAHLHGQLPNVDVVVSV